jgi:hypothetical protein
LEFSYLNQPYKTSGTWTDFKMPGIQFSLFGPQLETESILSVNGKKIKLTKFSGRYLNSAFALTGDVDLSKQEKINTQLTGNLQINLTDLKRFFPKLKDKFESIRPSGTLRVEINFAGDPRDFKSASIEARISSSTLSLYGLKADDTLIHYQQAEGLIDVPAAHFGLYNGNAELTLKANLNAAALPFRLNCDAQGIQFERLKLDTPMMDKDIAGIIALEAKINGFLQDFSKLSGVGQLSIREGRFWQLDLFKGLGVLLFSENFTNIVFSEGSCSFIIQDQSVFSDDIKLKSSLVDLGGKARIGFNGALDASLNVQVSNLVPLTGTFKDITTAIIGQAERFGVIQIEGTLKQPKYKYKASVPDIIKSFKDAIFNSNIF